VAQPRNSPTLQTKVADRLGGTATKTLPMTVLFLSRPKSPRAQAASNDYCNPGTPHRYIDTSHMHRPLIQSPYSLNNGYQTEENT
jgi:hypothetical protein